MKYCSKCGNELFDEAVVCPKCGCSAEAPKDNAKTKEFNKNQMKGVALIIAGIAVIVIFIILVASQL